MQNVNEVFVPCRVVRVPVLDVTGNASVVNQSCEDELIRALSFVRDSLGIFVVPLQAKHILDLGGKQAGCENCYEEGRGGGAFHQSSIGLL